MKNVVTIASIVVCAVVLTAFSIDAADTFSGSRATLLGQLIGAENSLCPVGMVRVPASAGTACIDKYEVSPSEECPYRDPESPLMTVANVGALNCVPDSVAHARPWVYVTYHQAAELCGKAGKRLPSHDEWFAAALGTMSAQCVTASGDRVSGFAGAACQAGSGAVHMIGNVWEWVIGDVSGRTYGSRTLPSTGYVANADSTGVATETVADPQPSFHNDYFWSKDEGAFVMMRGGFYGSGDDAGVYSTHAGIAPGFAGAAVGFRCVKDM